MIVLLYVVQDIPIIIDKNLNVLDAENDIPCEIFQSKWSEP